MIRDYGILSALLRFHNRGSPLSEVPLCSRVYGFGGMEWWNGGMDWTGMEWTGMEWLKEHSTIVGMPDL